MKKAHLIFLCTIILTVMVSGCDQINFMDEGKKDPVDTITITPIEDPQLAKLIIKPNEKSIEIPRDPFKPIYTASVTPVEAKKIAPIRNSFSDVYFIGMIKMDNKSIALLKVGDKKVMVKLDEQYKDFILKEVDITHVTFSNGENQITLKRGAKK